jgi:hypothetical protein
MEIRFQKNLRRSIDRAITRLQKTPKEIQSQFQKITVGTLENKNLPITFKASIDINVEQWRKLATETERLRDAFFSGGAQKSELSKRGEQALDNVMTNVALRFISAGLDEITSNLVRTLERQKAISEEFATIGIRGGVGYVPDLNTGTPPYMRDKESKALVPRGEKIRYDYETAHGEVPVTGYWGFQEFGAEGGRSYVPARSFFLSLQRTIHTEDQKEFDKVESWIKQRVNQYNTKAREIMA